MFDSLLNPPSIGSYSISNGKQKSHSYAKYDTSGACTIQDIIAYLEQTANLFEELAEQNTSNQALVNVCDVISGNLLFIARDHLTNHPDMPLNEAEKKCIVQVLVLLDSLCKEANTNGVEDKSLKIAFSQILEVMEYFKLWDWMEEQVGEEQVDVPNKTTPQIRPTAQQEPDTPYVPDPEIQRIIENLENGEKTSLTPTIKPYDPKRDYYGALNKLIGLCGVKDALNQQLAAFRFQKERKKLHPDLKTTISFNCLFLGNPGTGKTTVARELAGILKKEGLLKSGHYVEVKAADIISSYIGMSGRNAQLAVYKAIDGLLFIDEAYSIAGHEGNKGSASNEVIDALTPLIENYRDRICVVLAGYGKEMTQMIAKTNTGFSSRFQNTIQFENYNAKELDAIFHKIIAENHYTMTSDAETRTRRIFECFSEASSSLPTFANARTVRNFYLKMEAKMGQRMQASSPKNKKEMDTLIVSDTELTDAEIWSVLGVVKQSADATPYKGTDYIGHLRELLSLGKQPKTSTPDNPTVPQQEIPADGRLHGIMMTDTQQLAVKFYDALRGKMKDKDGVTCEVYWPDYIKENLLIPYTQAMRTQGVDYTLLDVSDEAYKDIYSQGRTWQNYLEILDRFSIAHQETIGGALFIVGGQDVIPSPVISNPAWMEDQQAEKEKSYREKDLEADMLYAYRSKDIRFRKGIELDYEFVFNNTPRFAVGRLPMEDGVVSIERRKHILGYFNSAFAAYAASETKPVGIDIKNHLVTAAESLNIVSHMMTKGLPLQYIPEEPGLVEGNIFISPQLVIDNEQKNVDEIIAHSNGGVKYVKALEQADMLTFATHGASCAQGDGCYGENKEKTHQCTAFLPELFTKCPAKVVSAICCWGARYINYRVEDSMLLTAMAKDVLIYMGACRSALGCFDVHIENGSPLVFATVLESRFERNLLHGLPAGYAISNAKYEYLKEVCEEAHKLLNEADRIGTVAAALLTVLEFNLYGDPLLSLIPIVSSSANKKDAYSVTSNNNYKLPDFEKCSYEVEQVTQNTEISLLDRIRQRTNANLMYIREKINKEVYAQFGLKPQELSSLVTVKTSGKESGYIFQYKRDLMHFEQRTFVHTNTKGEITLVYGTY